MAALARPYVVCLLFRRFLRNFAVMLGIKRLDSYMLKKFLPLLAMTFLICTFIVLMQFLWLHMQDLVGKGVGMGVMAQLFFYAALSMVPMALPLAVLLASLMTFGNLGESLELTALKAGGISLFRVMRPLIVLMSCIAVGAFFFQNDMLPLAQTKMWTILKSVREKTPELEIAEGEFNNQLPNINIYVEQKNRDTGTLYGVMIYDFRQGFERSRVIRADSARMNSADDKTHMFITLYGGELFENMREAAGQNAMRNQLYRREIFGEKLITVAFDVNLEMINEDDIRATYAGKNVKELAHTLDSLSVRLDSIGYSTGCELAQQTAIVPLASIPQEYREASYRPQMEVDPDSVRNANNFVTRRRYVQYAQNAIEQRRIEIINRALIMQDELKVYYRTGIEFHRRFTLSLACLVFFFIGAPLGAIIRKGGIGTPLIISVFLFIVYYIIDNTGYRMAREGQVPAWQGTWLSSAVLLPLGIFVTYKAVHDSAVFNSDAWVRIWRIVTGKNRRAITRKEVVIDDYVPEVAQERLLALQTSCRALLRAFPRPCGYVRYWRGGIPSADITSLAARLDDTVNYIALSNSQRVIDKLNEIPVIENFRILHPAPGVWSRLCMYAFPIGFSVWLLSLPLQMRFLRRVNKITQQLDNLTIWMQ